MSDEYVGSSISIEILGLFQEKTDSQQILNIGKLMLIIAGADGEITNDEMNYFDGFMQGLNAGETLLEKLKSFDWKSENIKNFIPLGDLSISRRRGVVYNAIKMGYADGIYSADEREAVAKIVSELGIDKVALSAIESLVELENTLAKARYRLFGQYTNDNSIKKLYQVTPQHQELLGMEYISHFDLLNLGKVLLIIAGADGEVAPKEMDYFFNFVRGMGAPQEMLEEFQQFNWINGDLENYLNLIHDLSLPLRHRILYIAIKIAGADNNYSEMEQIATKYVGQVFDINQFNITAIEGLINIEQSLHKLMKDLFFMSPQNESK